MWCAHQTSDRVIVIDPAQFTRKILLRALHNHTFLETCGCSETKFVLFYQFDYNGGASAKAQEYKMNCKVLKFVLLKTQLQSTRYNQKQDHMLSVNIVQITTIECVVIALVADRAARCKQ